MIKHHEGVRNKPYLCPAHIWTVGVGHVLYQEQIRLPMIRKEGYTGQIRKEFKLQGGDNRVWYPEQIDELMETAMQEITWDRVNELNSLKDHQEFLLKLLTSKDSFIRKKIIDQNLAYLNNRLTYYLDKMGLPHTVTFQNDLNVEIM